MDRLVIMLVALLAVACGSEAVDRPCEITAPQASLATIDCWQEFELQAARPLDSALPGALTIKTIIDRADQSALHLLDTNAYPLHQRFALDHLGWPPGVPFTSQYVDPQRRFLLGSITYYEEPALFTYELAPYDTAPAAMIAASMELLSAATYFGPSLAFHPTSQEQLQRAADLPAHIPVVTTEDIYAGIRYQPLNLGVTVGQVRILRASDLATEYVSPREIAVLDRVPNDISVVAGVVTAEFQTPLSHVNVLSQQRRTPNMGLRDAHERFAPHEGQWVRLEVGAFTFSVTPATQEEADAWWLAHRPDPVVVTPPDLSVTEILDIDDVGLADIPAVGGKAAHFGALRDLAAATGELSVRDGLVIPVYFYEQFLAQSGLDLVIDDMLADARFHSEGNYRRERLLALRQAMMAAPVDEALLTALEARLSAEFPGLRMRFRSSTNAEDLQGFSGAGLYDSASGEPGSAERPIAGAIRQVWASLWNTRAFEERAHVSIDHRDVAMAVLVHPAYRDETANGVAITANIFDPGRGGEDGFYINVQVGEISVVQPSANVVADQLMYYFFHDNQPATYYAHSSLVPPGTTVLSRRELFELGRALRAIRAHFRDAYDPPAGFGALPMDVEFKRLGTGESSSIEVKQARPYPGRGTVSPGITY